VIAGGWPIGTIMNNISKRLFGPYQGHLKNQGIHQHQHEKWSATSADRELFDGARLAAPRIKEERVRQRIYLYGVESRMILPTSACVQASAHYEARLIDPSAVCEARKETSWAAFFFYVIKGIQSLMGSGLKTWAGDQQERTGKGSAMAARESICPICVQSGD